MSCPGIMWTGPKGLFTWTRDSELPRGKRYIAFTWWFVVPGQCCPGSTSLPQGKFIEIWSLRIYLNSFSFYTNCYREWFQTRLPISIAFWNFFIGKFILNINNEHAQDCSCPRATFAFCSHGEKLPRQGGIPGVVQRVTRLSKLPRGNEKLMWTVTGVRPRTKAKLTPGSVSCPGVMSCPGIMWTGPKSKPWSFLSILSDKHQNVPPVNRQQKRIINGIFDTFEVKLNYFGPAIPPKPKELWKIG